MQDQGLRERFARASSYREFLRIAVESAGGVAAFSRRANFSSRSFLSEVLRGNRRISHASYEKVSKSLKLPSDLKALFQSLVAVEEPDVVSLPGKRDPAARLTELREKILAPRPQTDLKNLISTPHVPVIYAALGSRNKGATIGEIIRRTRLGRADALTAEASHDHLFYYTAFPISESELPRFKREFRELLLSHIERFQADEGDRVVRLNLGYFS